MSGSELLSRRWVRVLAASLPFLALVLPRLSFVPLFDGGIYADCLKEASEGHLGLLNCADHPSFAYLGPVTLAYWASGASAWGMNLANALLGVSAIAAFLGILERLHPESTPAERVVAGAVFASMPPFAAAALNLTVDFGTLVAFLWTVHELLARRKWTACAAGVALAFTKEPGIALAGLATVAWLVAFVLRRPMAWKDKLSNALSVLPMLLVPVLLVLYFVVRSLRGRALMWTDPNDPRTLLHQLTAFDPFDPVFRSYSAGVFLANFTWVLVAIVLAGALVAAGRVVLGLRREEGAAARELEWILLLGAAYVLTRHRTYTNVRYFLPVYPLLVLVAFSRLRELVRPIPVRGAVAAACVALFLVSNFRTLDPFSRAAFGTFRWGSHELLDMTSITGERFGHGRDQLVYNLEFLRFSDLLDDVVGTLRPDERTPLAMADRADWRILDAVGGDPPHRVMPARGRPRVPVRYADDLPANETLYWVEFPHVDGARELQRLEERYDVADRRPFERDGYVLEVLTLRLRHPGAEARP